MSAAPWGHRGCVAVARRAGASGQSGYDRGL